MSTRLAKLSIFTRYPVPGTAKTRLIPALGEVGAATVSRQMTEHTLNQIHLFQNQYQCPPSVEIQFAGGSLEQMRQWLGDGWKYVPQGEGSLGDRMACTFKSAFAAGMQEAIIIGTDCPELNASILHQAFQALAVHDLVLGPALDGGYYLIGLRQYVPELFRGISWSTTEVLQQTLEIAHQCALAIACLPTLGDVDYPEDLAIWQRVSLLEGKGLGPNLSDQSDISNIKFAI